MTLYLCAFVLLRHYGKEQANVTQLYFRRSHLPGEEQPVTKPTKIYSAGELIF